jgi:hypothetical protein
MRIRAPLADPFFDGGGQLPAALLPEDLAADLRRHDVELVRHRSERRQDAVGVDGAARPGDAENETFRCRGGGGHCFFLSRIAPSIPKRRLILACGRRSFGSFGRLVARPAARP